jgi:3-oxoacyl-[acyl-carrier protein] reductase
MFKQKVVLVTGAAQGIGYEIAGSFARAGASVGLVDVNASEVKKSAEKLVREGYSCLAFQADVSSAEQVRQVVQSALQKWGQIDIMVNNAGICPITPPLEISPEEWDKVLGINLKGTFLFSQAVIPAMQKQGHGKIINIASSAGQMGGISVGLHYSASKAGVLGLTKSLARILAPNIQVNAISPGTTESEMTRGWDDTTIANLIRQIPAGRLGRPSDTAAAVLFLASDEATFITGQTISVNGGLFMA